MAEPSIPGIGRCRSVNRDYAKIGRIGEGSFGKVYKARDKKTGESVALKRLFMRGEQSEGFSLDGLREISALRKLKHPNIIELRDVAVSMRHEVFLVFEVCDNDLMSFSESRKNAMDEAQAKCVMIQMLSAVKHMHDRGFVHRDIKMSNLLYKSGRVKLADFGLARPVPQGTGRYSTRVVTLWFRAPELLLGATTYGTSLDMWSVGCVAAELLLGRPLFPAAVEPEALIFISRLLGPPTPDRFPEAMMLPAVDRVVVDEGRAAIRRALAARIAAGKPLHLPSEDTFPGWRDSEGSGAATEAATPSSSGAAAAAASSASASSTSSRPPDAFEAIFPRLSPEGLDFLRRMLCYSPSERMTAGQALEHPYLTTAEPKAATPEEMPYCKESIVTEKDGEAKTPASASAGRGMPEIAPGPAADPTDRGHHKAARLIRTSGIGLALPPAIAAPVDSVMSAWNLAAVAASTAAAARVAVKTAAEGVSKTISSRFGTPSRAASMPFMST